MKINFEFKNITELEELFYCVENIADDLKEEFSSFEGTPLKESMALYEVIKRLEVKLLNEKAKAGEL
jgi:hypothetical protein